MQPTTAAVTKATGGAGATRTSLELAATLARAGHATVVLDVDLATQGLADHVQGRVAPDATAVLTGEAALGDAIVDLDVGVEGRVAACPARAPFERIARAKTPDAARRVEEALARAADHFDYVLVDTPPVATNPAVSAVTAVDRVAAVTPASDRGADGLRRLRERLRDVEASPGLTIATRADDEHLLEDADVSLPDHEVSHAAVPSCADPDESYAPAVAEAAEALFGIELDLDFESDGLLSGRLG